MTVEVALVAKQLVREMFPQARAALLAGSAARGSMTTTSDLDIVVVLSGPPAPYRETIHYEDWTVELFVRDEASLTCWYEREVSAFHPVLATMIASGVVLRDQGGASQLQEEASAILDSGPRPLTDDELASRRYALTDNLLDLEVVEHDVDEHDAVASLVLSRTAELFLLSSGSWLGTGKWLVRRLRETNSEVATELMSAHRVAIVSGNSSRLIAVADLVLNRVGGRMTEGYKVSD